MQNSLGLHHHQIQNINNTFDGTTNLMQAVPVNHAPTKSMQKRGANQNGGLNSKNYHKAAAAVTKQG